MVKKEKKFIRLRLSYLFGKIINMLFFKRKNYVYVEPHANGKTDCYDLINCNSDNCLKLVNYYLNNYHGSQRVVFFLECYDEKRIGFIYEYVNSIKNDKVKIVLLMSCWNSSNKRSFLNIRRFLCNSIKKYQCSFLISDTGWAHFFDKVKKQTAIDFNYCTPFKAGGLFCKKINYRHYNYIIETSKLCSSITSSEYDTPIERFRNLGFPRNDFMENCGKDEFVKKWLLNNDCLGKKIIIYVPTFRMQTINYVGKDIFGFSHSDSIQEFLEENNLVIITKMHPIQASKFRSIMPKNTIIFTPNYEFSIYDLFKYASLFISDYSSISTDFLLSHRPVIYLFSDFSFYNSDRGFSFEPIQSMCCGPVVTNWNELKEQVLTCISNFDYKSYFSSFSLWHKNDDNNSTKRCADFLGQLMK